MQAKADLEKQKAFIESYDQLLKEMYHDKQHDDKQIELVMEWRSSMASKVICRWIRKD